MLRAHLKLKCWGTGVQGGVLDAWDASETDVVWGGERREVFSLLWLDSPGYILCPLCVRVRVCLCTVLVFYLIFFLLNIFLTLFSRLTGSSSCLER